MQTRAPFYGRFAPVSWLLEKDIVEGRQEFDLERWESYSAEQRQTLLAKIVERTRKAEMPPVQYRMIHQNTRITDDEEQVLTAWASGGNAVENGGAIP